MYLLIVQGGFLTQAMAELAGRAVIAATLAPTKISESIPDFLESLKSGPTEEVTILIQDFIQKYVSLDFKAYMNICQPAYCDRIEEKTILIRLVEFLSTVGGLWTVIFGTTTLLWTILNMTSIVGGHKQPGAYYVWH